MKTINIFGAVLLLFVSAVGFSLTSTQSVSAEAVCTNRVIDWGSFGWDETNTSSTEVNTYFDEALHNKNPFHGLGSATGGVSGFLSQSFVNASGSGLDIDVYYSHNMHDQVALDTPNLYGGAAGANPDARVTGASALRFTRDYTANYTHGTHGNIRSPATVVYNFSEPVFLSELIIGSLSQITDHENAVVRAFDGVNATGNVVKASAYNNISDLDDDSTLIHGLGDAGGPVQSNDLSNVNLDPDNTFDASGIGTNIGSVADDGIYHSIGANTQASGAYGRVLIQYLDTPVRSIAVSTWMTTSPTGFSEDIYTDDFHSAIFAPVSFCEAVHDYGDAPDSSSGTGMSDYNTVGSDNGAVHEINTNIRIGASVDADNSLLQNNLANNDDSDGSDDEDGIADLSELDLTDNQTAPEINVSVFNNMGESATLYGWIDYNGDGVFDNASERASVAVPNGTNGIVQLSFPNVPSDSSSATGGTSYLRLRLSTDSSPSSNPTGGVANGEVEDYLVNILGVSTEPAEDEPETVSAEEELVETGSSTVITMLSGIFIVLATSGLTLLSYRFKQN